MDPFSSLPSELRLEILRLIRSERRILSLAQVSPIKLKQYITSKAFLTRSWLTSDLDRDMIQDAMAIITRPPLNVSGFQHLAHNHYCLWTGQQFTNPIDNDDHRLIEKLGKICRRLIHFIEDYVTKATSLFPPQAYLSLPCSFAIGATSNFKGQIVHQRFDAADLSDEERGRLLKAFLRFEAICKTYPAVITAHTDMVMGRNENSPWEEIIRSFADVPFYSFGQHGLQLWEKEAVSCVYAYLQSLYGAMFAQCGDSWLPCPSHGRGLLYPDNFFMDADLYASDLGLGPSTTESMSHRLPNLIPCWLAGFGFDLAAGLLRFATDGDEQRCRLKRWLEEFCEARAQVIDNLCGFPGYSPLRQQKCCGDGPDDLVLERLEARRLTSPKIPRVASIAQSDTSTKSSHFYAVSTINPMLGYIAAWGLRRTGLLDGSIMIVTQSLLGLPTTSPSTAVDHPSRERCYFEDVPHLMLPSASDVVTSHVITAFGLGRTRTSPPPIEFDGSGYDKPKSSL
ncbi:hypothetical protein NM208_g7539 [Fusarium decemcellulare]|uniref:Uncharacterized protein n=1 Tax=Fusarium decemcellulare TaxID=57161 RepID=A0ACC1S8S3_9HYPO|nr:hypothetical protein NM208_g7539 [Fusarium decemcellulare]